MAKKVKTVEISAHLISSAYRRTKGGRTLMMYTYSLLTLTFRYESYLAPPPRPFFNLGQSGPPPPPPPPPAAGDGSKWKWLMTRLRKTSLSASSSTTSTSTLSAQTLSSRQQTSSAMTPRALTKGEIIHLGPPPPPVRSAVVGQIADYESASNLTYSNTADCLPRFVIE